MNTRSYQQEATSHPVHSALSSVGNQLPIEFDYQRGTSIAFCYRGGVILAVNSKSTDGLSSSSRSGQIGEKVIKVNNYLLGSFAGNSDCCRYKFQNLRDLCKSYELRHKEHISVAIASELLSNIILNNNHQRMSFMLAGYDDKEPSLYGIDSDGTCTHHQILSVGSGAYNASEILHSSGYKWDLADTEAYKLGKSAITQIAERDAYSGDYFKIYHITASGWKRVGCFPAFSREPTL